MVHYIDKIFRESFYRNSISLILNFFIVAFIGFIFWIICARTISSQDIGIATAIISAVTLITGFSRLGMDIGLIRFFYQSWEKEKLFNSVLSVTLISSILISVIFIIVIKYISPSLVFLQQQYIYIILFITFVVLTQFNYLQNTLLLAIKRAEIQLIQNLFTIIRLPVIIIIAFLGIIGIIVSIELSILLSFIIGLYIIYKYGLKFKFEINLDILNRIIPYSIGNYFADFIFALPQTLIPIILLNKVGAKEAGYFYIAFTIASMLFSIPNSICNALFVEGSNNASIKDTILKSIKAIIVILIPALIVILLFGDKILLLFGSEYSDNSYRLLLLISISSLLSCVMSIYISIKKIQKDVLIINYLDCIYAFLLIAISYILIGYYGILGVGYAWLITYTILSIIVLMIMILKDNWLYSYKILFYKL